ncbi:hypothetical protein KAR91_45265 [Candidatus Pacearchaeota archaeon]|nr:hypothetical protein [Candidatus Pacearchaeota archaeon]
MAMFLVILLFTIGMMGLCYLTKAIGYMLGIKDAKDNAIKNGKIFKDGVYYTVEKVE